MRGYMNLADVELLRSIARRNARRDALDRRSRKQRRIEAKERDKANAASERLVACSIVALLAALASGETPHCLTNLVLCFGLLFWAVAVQK